MGGPLLTTNSDFTLSTMKSPSDVLSRQALVVLLCLTLCDPMDCSPPGSYVHGILQASILEWAAIPFSRGSFPTRDQTQVSLIGNTDGPQLGSPGKEDSKTWKFSI